MVLGQVQRGRKSGKRTSVVYRLPSDCGSRRQYSDYGSHHFAIRWGRQQNPANGYKKCQPSEALPLSCRKLEFVRIRLCREAEDDGCFVEFFYCEPDTCSAP